MSDNKQLKQVCKHCDAWPANSCAKCGLGICREHSIPKEPGRVYCQDCTPLTPLAPSGITAHNHEVEYSQSGLALHWTWNRKEYLRKFTPEETLNLLNFLEQHRSEIEQASQSVCSSCGKPIGQGGAIAELNHIRYCYCSDCHTNPFA